MSSQSEDISEGKEDKQSISEWKIEKEWKITREWLQSILEKYYDTPVTIEDFDTKPECTTETALSTVTHVECKYADQNTKSQQCFLIKQLPQDPFSRFFVTEGQFDLREIMFYTQLMPDIRKFWDSEERRLGKLDVLLLIPLCYYADYSPINESDDSPIPRESILVVEDVRARERTVDFKEGLSLHEAAEALKSIARMHGCSLAMRVTEGLSLFEHYPFLFKTAKAAESYQHLVERGLPQLSNFLEKKPGLQAILEAVMTLRPRTREIIYNLLAPEGPLTCIIHADFWCNNVIFNDQGSCYIVEWQMVTCSRPTNDIALLLISSVQTGVRRNHTKQLLDIYWKELTEVTSEFQIDICEDLGYTREDLDNDYRRSQLLALLLCIGSVDVALGNDCTEQRLIDVLKDLYKDGVLTDETIITATEADS